MRILLYILRLHFGPFLFGTSVVIFLFLLQTLFRLLPELSGKGLGMGIIAEVFALNLAWILVMAVPMGVLVATLMAFGGLSATNEITAIKVAGTSATRMMLLPLAAGVVAFWLLYQFNDKVLPEVNHRLSVMRTDIAELQPVFAVEEGRFSLVQGYSILARKVDRERNELLNVTIYREESGGRQRTVINAGRAQIMFNADFTRLLMTLQNGEVQQLDFRRPEAFRRIEFARYRVSVPTSGFRLQRTDPSGSGRGDRTLSIDSMRVIADTGRARSARAGQAIIAELDAFFSGPPLSERPRRDDCALGALAQYAPTRVRLESQSEVRSIELRRANQYLVEVHKKWSIPAACVVFVLIGAPLGIAVRRGNFGVAAAIALGFFAVYTGCLMLGETLADRLLIAPWLAMWMANIVVGAIGVGVTMRVSRAVGE